MLREMFAKIIHFFAHVIDNANKIALWFLIVLRALDTQKQTPWRQFVLAAFATKKKRTSVWYIYIFSALSLFSVCLKIRSQSLPRH
jgi:hypothetical protein